MGEARSEVALVKAPKAQTSEGRYVMRETPIWRTALLRVSIIIGLILTPILLSHTPALANTLSQTVCTSSNSTFCDANHAFPTFSASATNINTASSSNKVTSVTVTGTTQQKIYTVNVYCSADYNNILKWYNGFVYILENGQTDTPANYQSLNAGGYDSSTGTPPGGLQVTSYSLPSGHSFVCPTGQIARAIKVFYQYQSSPFDETDVYYAIAAATIVCTQATYSNAVGSWSAGTLAVRFTYSATVFPSGGWNVLAPDPGNNNGTPTGTIGLNATVDSSPGTYYAAIPMTTAPSTFTARIWANDTSDQFGTNCYKSITLSSNPISSTPPVTPQSGGNDTGTDNTQATNCTLSLNPSHWIKCLFWPETSFQQWNTLQTTFKTHAPTSLVIGGIGYVSDTEQFFQNNSTTGNACDNGDFAKDCDTIPTFDGPASCDETNPDCYSGKLNLLTSVGDVVQNNGWGTAIYDLFSLGVALTGFMLCWRMVSMSIGGKESGE